MRRQPFKNTMEQSLKDAGVSSIDIAWFQHTHGRKFAPLPDCKLRKLALKAGFRSAAEFLAAERAKRIREKEGRLKRV